MNYNISTYSYYFEGKIRYKCNYIPRRICFKDREYNKRYDNLIKTLLNREDLVFSINSIWWISLQARNPEVSNEIALQIIKNPGAKLDLVVEYNIIDHLFVIDRLFDGVDVKMEHDVDVKTEADVMVSDDKMLFILCKFQEFRKHWSDGLETCITKDNYTRELLKKFEYKCFHHFNKMTRYSEEEDEDEERYKMTHPNEFLNALYLGPSLNEWKRLFNRISDAPSDSKYEDVKDDIEKVITFDTISYEVKKLYDRGADPSIMFGGQSAINDFPHKYFVDLHRKKVSKEISDVSELYDVIGEMVGDYVL
jgi:hypothetical protein